MEFLIQTANIIIDLLILVIFLRMILSWFVRGNENVLNNFLIQCTEPILRPIRRLLPGTGPLDFSPMIAILLLEVIRNIINVLLGFNSLTASAV
ncbi:MAG: YggT family protein [Candidatus Gracilibacteria bacterium]